nr:hypothetical protein [Wohlfahrtiimonas chitiniclastica]
MDGYERPKSIKGLPLSEILEFFRWMDFKDPIGNPLILNEDFLSLIADTKLSCSDNDLLCDYAERFPSIRHLENSHEQQVVLENNGKSHRYGI